LASVKQKQTAMKNNEFAQMPISWLGYFKTSQAKYKA
jgi:hypothetical protein